MNNKYMYYSTCLLLLAFPSLCNLVRHGGSTLMVLLTVMGFAVLLSDKNHPLLTKPEKWVMWAFTAYFGIHLLSFAVNGLLGNLFDPRVKHLDHEFRFLFILPIFMLLRLLRIKSGVFWYSVTLGALISGMYALFTHFLLSGVDRIKGGYHEIAFGDLSLALAFMSIVSIDWFRRKRTSYLLLPMAASSLGIAGSIMSGTRGAWIAFPGLLCVLFFYFAKYFNLRTRLWMVAACCILAVAGYTIPATHIAERIDSVFIEIAEYAQGYRSSTSAAERIEGWRVAFDIFRQNPVLGAGPGTFEPLAREMVAKGAYNEIAALHSKPHSSYLTAMSECGLTGLIALLALLGMPLWLAVKYIKSDEKVWDHGFALVLLAVAFAHFALTEAIFSRNVNVSFYIIMTASLMAISANEKNSPTASTPEN